MVTPQPTKTKLQLCPFSAQALPCSRATCDNCEIRIAAEAQENRRIGENMQDYWIHSADGAER